MDYLEYIALVLLTFTIISVLVYLLRKTLDYFINRNSRLLFVDPTNFIFIKNSLSFILYSIGLFWIFYKIPYFKSLGTGLFASAGVLAAILGFASQKAVANIIGGIFILVFKPFRVGDPIEINKGHRGVVEEITLRHTIIKNYENKRVIVPNSIISEDTIINARILDSQIRKFVDVNIRYDADLALAEEILRQEILKHPNCLDVRTPKEKESGQPQVAIKVISIGDYSVTLRAFVWTKDFNSAEELFWDVLRAIKFEFDKNNIPVPNPYRPILFEKQQAHEDLN